MTARKYEVRQRGMTTGTIYKVVGLAMVNPRTTYIVTFCNGEMARYGLTKFNEFITQQDLKGLIIDMKGTSITVTSYFLGQVFCEHCKTTHEATAFEFINRLTEFDEQVTKKADDSFTLTDEQDY